MKKLAQRFNTAAQDSNRGSLSRESEALPLSHCALHNLDNLDNLSTVDQSSFPWPAPMCTGRNMGG